jgi:hypothetical protein
MLNKIVLEVTNVLNKHWDKGNILKLCFCGFLYMFILLITDKKRRMLLLIKYHKSEI